MVLLMSVNPGFGGQKFEAITYKRLEKLRNMIDNQGLETLIQIDGGVDDGNIKQLSQTGADVFVSGSHVFGHAKPEVATKRLKKRALDI